MSFTHDIQKGRPCIITSFDPHNYKVKFLEEPKSGEILTKEWFDYYISCNEKMEVFVEGCGWEPLNRDEKEYRSNWMYRKKVKTRDLTPEELQKVAPIIYVAYENGNIEFLFTKDITKDRIRAGAMVHSSKWSIDQKNFHFWTVGDIAK